MCAEIQVNRSIVGRCFAAPLSKSKKPLCVRVCVLELESVKLARLVFNRLFEMCCLWMKELPFHRRPQPYYETSIHAIKNMRRKMEDKHIIIPDFNTLFNVQVDPVAMFHQWGQSG